MKVAVFVITYNCADVLPYFLRHYSGFANKIVAWDDHSDDGTRTILDRHPLVSARDWSYESGINEDLFLRFWYEEYPKARGEFDWLMLVDPDEFIYCYGNGPVLMQALRHCQEHNIDVIIPQGFNMVGDGLPEDTGAQIWEMNPMGVAAPVYSKPVIFQPHIDIKWNRGKHAVEESNGNVASLTSVKLLHYRYLGFDYTQKKNAKNYARCGLLSGDKGAAWSCHPDHKGEHSAPWAEHAKKHAFDVIKS